MATSEWGLSKHSRKALRLSVITGPLSVEVMCRPSSAFNDYPVTKLTEALATGISKRSYTCPVTHILVVLRLSSRTAYAASVPVLILIKVLLERLIEVLLARY